MELKQYAIILVNLDPTVGSEIQKTRPCAIISPNEMNKHLKTVVIAPMTTNVKAYPTRVEVNYNNKRVMIALDQIRTVDRIRVIKVIGKLHTSEITQCKAIIKETFVD
ncbi:type II toxin-antitoxin system PemK/MazF family toxin [Leeuwenhoekiella nanhaiensis]|uniref:mRNA interferase n=1 Tax=Leeuwenhoekiella nanhaiensis TaxID=1655491 RepID=A0A2G1VU72_9FLAO|nr:type II toxin-antitoxin system PemK/MazF family toxin [Leeuwenhoekiella nanhaiensis]PHQ30305.1 growth inhibitor PemK [Leeuwenhoekiella nanhaiensis]